MVERIERLEQSDGQIVEHRYLKSASGLPSVSVLQHCILSILDSSRLDGSNPTLREMIDYSGRMTNSTSVVKYNLNKLLEAGYIDQTGKGKSRSYIIKVNLQTVHVDSSS